MALIKCEECAREISSKASSCPYCGCPVGSQATINDKFSEPKMNVCPKCGKFMVSRVITGELMCSDCKCKMINCYTSEDKYDSMSFEEKQNWKTRMRQQYVITSREFDPKLFENRISMESGKTTLNENTPSSASVNTKSLTIECPYCHSTDTRKISGLSKVGSVALFGVFALGKTTKQWHCDNCNSDF